MSTADVTLLTPYPPAGLRHGGHSGVASYSANLATALAAEGARVRVIAPHEPGEPPSMTEHGVQVLRAGRRGPGALLHATRAALSSPTRVIHLQHELFLYGGPSALPSLPLAVERLRRQAPLAATLHQVVDPGDVDRDYTRMHRVAVPPAMARSGLRSVQAYLANRTHRAIVHEAAFADLVPGARVIHHGVETAEHVDRTAARRALGVDDHRLVVLCFGFVAPYKGVETALAAAELAGREVQLVVAGGPHPRLADGEDYLAALARRHPNARFTGYVPDHDVSRWHSAADIALLCYPRPHASSGALALALAHGTPLLLGEPVARCVAAPEELEIPLDPSTIAERLRRLANHRGTREELRTATRRFATGRSWPEVARQHLDLYEEMLRAPHAADRTIGTRRPVG
jgi:glycosyltransferase involved in cell wall biosynthesis